MGTFRNTIIVFLFCFISACSTTKHLPKDDQLYTGASVKLETSGTTSRQHKVLKSDLKGMTRPKPNKRFLGMPMKLGIYNMFRKAKPNSFFGRFREKNGEPPVLVSSVDLESNTTLLRSHLENKGFFKAAVTGDTIIKGKKGSASYDAKAGVQYKVNSIRFPTDSSTLNKAIQQSISASLLKAGDPYDLDVIRGERTRIDAFLKERGFYYFSPEYLIVRVDSTIGQNRVDMEVAVKADAPEHATVPYSINDVYIYTNYNLNNPRLDTSRAEAVLHNGYYVVDRRKRFKPKLFDQVMQFKPGELYNRTDHNQTVSRLINLNEFKFVRNRFERVPDSAKLDAFYYLTPFPKKSLRAEFNVTTKSNNLNGIAVQVGWRNRNTFRGGEQLSISAYVGSEVQFGGTTVDKEGNPKRYNTYRSGAEMNFAIPRFIVPFFDIRTKGNYVPRTNIQMGYDLLNRRELYTVNAFRIGLGYLWKPTIIRSHELYPININYVQPINVTDEYRDSVMKYPYLRHVIDSQFVLGTTYQFTYNELAIGLPRRNAFYFTGLVDLSGNIAGLITGADVKAGKQERIFNAPFDQYIKLEFDGRYYKRIGVNSSWVNRLDIGLGHPHGNSLELPYIKQFFSGGNNSIRAFRSRSVGPGTFKEVSTTNSSNFYADQTGDIKLEMNSEFRPHISGPLYGAVFIDAGNIWLANEDPDRPGGKFTGKFLSQLAVGAGVGLRFDIQLFVIRLDVAFPLRKPWEQNPWVMDQIDFGDKAWKKENVIYNLAIGYPF